MFRRISLIVVLVLAAIFLPPSEPRKSCPTVACRAQAPFRTCNKPLDGAKILSARVLAVSWECSSRIVSIQVEDATANTLPAVVEIDLGPCIYFTGKVGDAIQIALRQPHSPDVRRYHLACDIWGSSGRDAAGA